MGVVLVRSAYSTNIKERRDCSCALFTPDGGLIAFAEHIPIHLGSMQGLMTKITSDLERWNLKPSDVIIANDPFQGGGSHLPDVTLVQPVFFTNKLVAFVANIAHWADIGGMAPGIGTAGGATELLQEGIRIPPTRLIRQGKMQTDLLNLLLLNMRKREERLGDLHAQISALHIGEIRLHELCKHHGVSAINSSISELNDYSERKIRAALLEFPSGCYQFRDEMDDDGISPLPLPIYVRITIEHGTKPSISFDFEGTAPQTIGGINMVESALLATVYYAVKAIVCPDAPPNAGFQKPIKIKAPKGSLVNAQEPAAVGGRTDTCQRVVDTIMGALSNAVPEKVIAAANGATTAIIFGGTKSLSGEEFIYVEALGGGMGARATKDGMDGVQVHITNTSNLPIEAMELEYPLQVKRYSLAQDSGGPGRFRGGMAIRKDIQALAPMLFLSHSDRHRIAHHGYK